MAYESAKYCGKLLIPFSANVIIPEFGKPITEGQIRPFELFERLLMYTTFEGCADVYVWESQKEEGIPPDCEL